MGSSGDVLGHLMRYKSLNCNCLTDALDKVIFIYIHSWMHVLWNTQGSPSHFKGVVEHLSWLNQFEGASAALKVM